MRAAIYYAPDAADPLWQAASTWLGRDAETAANVQQPGVPNIADLTASPRLYGFHATLKPPMRLATSYDQLMADVIRLAARLTSFDLPVLAVANVKSFLALRDMAPCPALQSLADACVTDLDRHRAPPTESELRKRRQHGLGPAQDAMLTRWGYPHVLETWFFHMTLTRRLTTAEQEAVRPLAERHFAVALARPRRVEALTVFTQSAEGAPFLVAERVPLAG